MQNYPYLLEHFTHTPPLRFEGIILRDLIDHEYTTNERLIEQIWGDREDGGPLCPKVAIGVYICRLRKKLHPWWGIKRHYSREIYLTEN